MPEDIEMAMLDVESKVIATGFTIPWSIEVLAEDEYLVTERMGGIYYINDGQSVKLEGLPETRTVQTDRPYGGLMDVSLHPSFDTNRWVYIAYVNDAYQMAVARFTFANQSVQHFDVIFESNAFSIGSRIAWQDDGHFFVTQGMGGSPKPDPGPQDLNHDGGKIHRLHADGSIPEDNPIFDEQSGPTSIWSYGHRDPQGLFFDAEEGVLYANEHGPFGGDELNIIQKGGNYGWPRFSHGLNYDGTPVGDLSEDEAGESTVLPVKAWGPLFSMAPSGLERLDEATFPAVAGQFVWGSLAQHRLIAYDMSSDQTTIIGESIGRVRDVTQLANGELLLLIDSGSPKPSDPGRLVKLSPR